MPKKKQPAADDPWADERPAMPDIYTEAIRAAIIRCQHCARPIGVTDKQLGIPAAVTCTICVETAVRGILGHNEPPF